VLVPKPKCHLLIMADVFRWRKLLGLRPNEGPISWESLLELINAPLQIIESPAEVEVPDIPGVHSRPPNEELVGADFISPGWGCVDPIDLNTLVGWVPWREFHFAAVEWFWFDTCYTEETWKASARLGKHLEWKKSNDYSEMFEQMKLGFHVVVGGVLPEEEPIKHGGWKKARVKKPYYAFINLRDRAAFYEARINIPF